MEPLSSNIKNKPSMKVSMYWGDILYDTAVCHAKEEITIGRGAGNTFILDAQQVTTELNDSFKLLEVRPGNTAEVHFSDKYVGHLRLGEKHVSLQMAIHEKLAKHSQAGDFTAQLTTKDKADIAIGHVSFTFEWMQPQKPLPRSPLISKKSWPMVLLFLISISSVIAFFYFVKPPEPEKPPERLITIEPPPKPPKAFSDTPSSQAPSQAAMGQQKTPDGGSQKGEAGKAATKPPEKPSAASSLRKSNLGSLVSGLTSVGSNSPAKNTNATVESSAEQAGTGGFSTKGLKTGGGGKSIGIGRTVGQGEGGFGGTGRLGLAGNSSVDGVGAGGGGKPRVAGEYPREVIESFIRRRLDRIRLCYERQLNFFPNLSGKIAIHFVIGKTGQVMKASLAEDTMKNDAVKSCILAEVQGWNFPAPEGGMQVSVDYPFVFESSARRR